MSLMRGFLFRAAGLKRPSLRTQCIVSALRFSSSNSRWKQRQGKDAYAREAKVQGLKSRAAFKLLEMDTKYRLFKPRNVVVDLGYAPGSWSQIALERTRPGGKVVGIDLIPAEPPKGVATFQGDFLSPGVQRMVKDFIYQTIEIPLQRHGVAAITESSTATSSTSAIDNGLHAPAPAAQDDSVQVVDIVLSDMSAPWEQTSGFNVNSLSNPYYRLMNTSGVAFRDHAGSMESKEAFFVALCRKAKASP
ncbi:cell division cycle protein [Cordyceps javanica]|uniref:rRNA methyltransferase 2, mitochondrial n=1 Tax=Cordyceps javanica TaxID=43265 RepID=A0A545UWQ2_9HYPO|nr:cell division cycle protein [Cordyceps javanica]